MDGTGGEEETKERRKEREICLGTQLKILATTLYSHLHVNQSDAENSCVSKLGAADES